MANRVFIFGAGFSKPAGMPLATEILPLLKARLDLEEMAMWLDAMRTRLAWLSGCDGRPTSFKLNIEQVFHYAHFDLEVHRLRQHLAPVGRRDGPGTPWNQAESVHAWLSYLETELRDVIFERDVNSDLSHINRWARSVTEHDVVITFNYDTLVERAIVEVGKGWNHGTGRQSDVGIPIFKLHGSIDWIVAHRSESFSKLDLLFDKENSNQTGGMTGHVEDDCRLWRCQSAQQLRNWIEGRDIQLVPDGASPRTIGIAGLGAYKDLHRIPGLGHVWTQGLRKLYQADLAIIVGFSMSDFDAMAQMQFADVARARMLNGTPLCVIVVDPSMNQAAMDRFRRVFRMVEFVETGHEQFDWADAAL